MQIKSHHCRYCQKPFTRAGSKRHYERYTCWKPLENGYFPSSPAVTREDAPKITLPTKKQNGFLNGIERGKPFLLQEAKLQANRTQGLKRSRRERPLSAQGEKHNCQRKKHHERKCQRSHFLPKTTLGYLVE